MTSKPLQLVVGESQPMRFAAPEEFEFSLAGRTSVPSQKIAALMNLAPRELKQEAATIDELEQRLQTMLVRMEDASINRAMMRLDPSVFSQDHNWRSIINGLNQCDEEYREYKVIALKMYLQYLHSRKVLLKELYAAKRNAAVRGPADNDARVATGEEKLGATTSPDGVLSGAPNESNLPVHGKDHPEPVIRRLPKGEPVAIHIRPGEDVEIRLSKHKLRLARADHLTLIDQEGRRYQLARKRCLVGRDPQCDIGLKPSLKDISRKHVIIEDLGDDRLQLTDLSTYGTFIIQ